MIRAGAAGRTRPTTRAARRRAGGDRPVAAPSGPLHQVLAEHGLDTVLLAVIDQQGRLKGKMHDAAGLSARLRTGRITPEMCGYVLGTDLAMTPPQDGAFSWKAGFGDVWVLHDQHARVLPWVPGAALLLADPMDGPEPHPLAPVAVLERQTERLSAFGVTAKVGVESEFVLYEGSARDVADGRRTPRPATSGSGDYALDQPSAVGEFGRRLRQALAGAGLPVEALKGEGAPGQLEVTLPYGEPRRVCEQHVLVKHAAKAIAEERLLAASFMAAPATGVGSGLHLHVSLHGADGPLLADDPDGGVVLSELGQWAVAGLLQVLPVTGPLWAPYVNSYKRLQPHSFAPSRWSWGRDNRTCAVRVVGHGPSLRLEVRVPGADANPLLATAAVLAGISHGIEAGLKPPAATEGDAYQDTAAAPLPASLAEALGAFEASELAADLLGRPVVRHLAAVARMDLDHHAARVTDAELERGFAQA
ncbi:glutamine synthetase family protein [Kitasatospora sp. NPDC001664]